MKEKQTMTLDQLFVKEYLDKKKRIEELEAENNRLTKALKTAMNIVDDSIKMIDSLEIERSGEYLYIRGFLGKLDIAFDLYEAEIKDREKMKKKEEEKPKEKEEDHAEKVDEKDTEEETTNE